MFFWEDLEDNEKKKKFCIHGVTGPMVLVYGMAGMRDFDGMLTFRPRRTPDQPGKILFQLAYRG